MISFFLVLLSLAFGAVEKIPRAGVAVPEAQAPWQKMTSLPVLQIPEVDVVYVNSKNPKNQRILMTQFGDSSKICAKEFSSLSQGGFKVTTTRKPGWLCLLRAEKAHDVRLLGIREVKRKSGRWPALVSQAVYVELNPQVERDFHSWISASSILPVVSRKVMKK